MVCDPNRRRIGAEGRSSLRGTEEKPRFKTVLFFDSESDDLLQARGPPIELEILTHPPDLRIINVHTNWRGAHIEVACIARTDMQMYTASPCICMYHVSCIWQVLRLTLPMLKRRGQCYNALQISLALSKQLKACNRQYQKARLQGTVP